MLVLNPCQKTQEDEDLSLTEAGSARDHRVIVSVTAGLFILKTGSVDFSIAKATKFLLEALCNVKCVG